MAQVSVGKLLPNLKVTLGNAETNAEVTEGNSNESLEKQINCSDEKSNVEMVRFWMESLQNPKIYKNKSGGFTTGLDLTSEQNTELLDKRAERFGLEKEESLGVPSINSLYESLDINVNDRNCAKTKNIRFDALHMRGVNELNTNEIFHYFKDYGPASVEWINDFSCNVVWLDETSCARALLGVSKPLNLTKTSPVQDEMNSDDLSEPSKTASEHRSPLLIPEEEINKESDSKDEASMVVDDDSPIKSSSSDVPVSLDIPIPPGCWRLGTAHPKAKFILLRFATKDDKKLPGAEKRSNYYKKYGNPNYGGLRGLISSSRKRKMQTASTKRAIELGSSKTLSLKSTSSDIPAQRASNSKSLRMRMYADEEELKTKKLRSQDSFTFGEKEASVHSRLGTKYTRDDLCHLGNYLNAPKQKNWSSSEDLRKKLKRIKDSSSTKHRSPLCIED